MIYKNRIILLLLMGIVISQFTLGQGANLGTSLSTQSLSLSADVEIDEVSQLIPELWNRDANLNFEQFWNDEVDIKDYMEFYGGITREPQLVEGSTELDMDIDGTWFYSRCLKIKVADNEEWVSSQIGFDINDSMIENDYEFSGVFMVNGTNFNFLSLSFYNDNSDYVYVRFTPSVVSIYNASGHIISESVSLNLNKPVYLYSKIDNDENMFYCKIANIDSMDNLVSISVGNQTQYDSDMLDYMRMNIDSNDEYVYLYAMDSNYNLWINEDKQLAEMDKAKIDEGYRWNRILELYQSSQLESWELRDYNNFDVGYEYDCGNNYTVSNEQTSIVNELESEQELIEEYEIGIYDIEGDYKLDKDGNQKDGIVEWTSMVDGSSGGSSTSFGYNIDKRKDVCCLNDTGIADGAMIYYEMDNSVNGVFDVYFWKNNTKTFYINVLVGSTVGFYMYLTTSVGYPTVGSIGNYDLGVWNKLTFVYDCNVDLVDIYLNNELLQDNLVYYSDVSYIDRIRFATYSSHSDYEVYIDSIGIIEENYKIGSNEYVSYWDEYVNHTIDWNKYPEYWENKTESGGYITIEDYMDKYDVMKMDNSGGAYEYCEWLHEFDGLNNGTLKIMANIDSGTQYIQFGKDSSNYAQIMMNTNMYFYGDGGYTDLPNVVVDEWFEILIQYDLDSGFNISINGTWTTGLNFIGTVDELLFLNITSSVSASGIMYYTEFEETIKLGQIEESGYISIIQNNVYETPYIFYYHEGTNLNYTVDLYTSNNDSPICIEMGNGIEWKVGIRVNDTNDLYCKQNDEWVDSGYGFHDEESIFSFLVANKSYSVDYSYDTYKNQRLQSNQYVNQSIQGYVGMRIGSVYDESETIYVGNCYVDRIEWSQKYSSINALEFSISEENSTMQINKTNTLDTDNENWMSGVVVNNPNDYWSVKFGFGNYYVGVDFHNYSFSIFTEWNEAYTNRTSSLSLYHSDNGIFEETYVDDEIVIGLFEYSNLPCIYVRVGNIYEKYTTMVEDLPNWDNLERNVIIRSGNSMGNASLTSKLIVKGIFEMYEMDLYSYDYYLHAMPIEMRHRMLKSYTWTNYQLNLPSLTSDYDYWYYYISEITVEMEMNGSSELDYMLLQLEFPKSTESQSNSSSIYVDENENELWAYGQYDEFYVNITDTMFAYNYYGVEYLSEIDLSIRWYFYYDTPQLSMLDSVLGFLVPLSILVVFPYAFGQRWKGKGTIVGFLFGFIVMGVSQFISIGYTIILCIASIVIAYFVYKGGNESV